MGSPPEYQRLAAVQQRFAARNGHVGMPKAGIVALLEFRSHVVHVVSVVLVVFLVGVEAEIAVARALRGCQERLGAHALAAGHA